MKGVHPFRLAILAISVCLLSTTTVHAAKVKSSKHYLEQVEKGARVVNNDLKEIRQVLQLAVQPGSFLTTDFWGIEPAWYLTIGDMSPDITNLYPYTQHLLNHWGPWKKFPTYAVRNINDIILTPVMGKRGRSSKQWNELIAVRCNLLGGYSSMRYFKKWTSDKFISAGVPQNQLEKAWRIFGKKLDPAGEILSQIIYQPFDTLFSGFTINGEPSTYDKVGVELEKKGLLNIDNVRSPVLHKNVFTEEAFQQIKTFKDITSYKDFYKSINKRNSNKDDSFIAFYGMLDPLSFNVSTSVQQFIVAGSSSKSVRFNQLRKLEKMLEAKVQNGDAVKKTNKKYTLYEDASAPGQYKGVLAINYETGRGYWQSTMVSAGDDLAALALTLKENSQKLQKTLVDYYNLCAEETIKELGNKGAVTNDF